MTLLEAAQTPGEVCEDEPDFSTILASSFVVRAGAAWGIGPRWPGWSWRRSPKHGRLTSQTFGICS